MRSAALVDSGPLIALFDRDDADHARVVEFLRAHRRLRLLSTWAVVNETCALLGSRVGKQSELDFLEWVERGGLAVVAQDAGVVPRIRALIARYRDLPFDFADASLAVLAEQSGIVQVLTLDRDFDVFRDARGRLLKSVLPAIRAKARSATGAKP